jgi:ribonuclease E
LKSSRSSSSTPRRPRRARRRPLDARERLRRPVVEAGAVGQPGERVGEGAPRELGLERGTLGHVAGVVDHAAHGRVVQQVDAHPLDRAPRAVGAADAVPAARERARRGEARRELRRHAGRVVGVDERDRRPSHHRVGRVPVLALHGRAHVGHATRGVDHEDHVGRVLHERTEPRLAAPQPLHGAAQRLGRGVEAQAEEAQLVERRRRQPRREVAALERADRPARAPHAVGEPRRALEREPPEPDEARRLEHHRAERVRRPGRGGRREGEPDRARGRVDDGGGGELHARGPRQSQRVRRDGREEERQADVAARPERDDGGGDEQRVDAEQRAEVPGPPAPRRAAQSAAPLAAAMRPGRTSRTTHGAGTRSTAASTSAIATLTATTR